MKTHIGPQNKSVWFFCTDNLVDDPTARKLPEKETDERNSSILTSVSYTHLDVYKRQTSHNKK